MNISLILVVPALFIVRVGAQVGSVSPWEDEAAAEELGELRMQMASLFVPPPAGNFSHNEFIATARCSDTLSQYNLHVKISMFQGLVVRLDSVGKDASNAPTGYITVHATTI